jgi:hypothetical protein
MHKDGTKYSAVNSVIKEMERIDSSEHSDKPKDIGLTENNVSDMNRESIEIFLSDKVQGHEIVQSNVSTKITNDMNAKDVLSKHMKERFPSII